MEPKFSKFESEVALLLKAKTTTSVIATTLEKSTKSILNTIKRIGKNTLLLPL